MRNAPYSKSLIDVLATSLASLDDVTRSLFEVLSLLDAEKIPEDLFENEELKSQIPFLKVRFKCIYELMTSSLIGNEGNPGVGEIRYFHMHELWNDYTREETKGASRHHETADLYHKLGWHLAEQREYSKAMLACPNP
jgi:hypothetical protein